MGHIDDRRLLKVGIQYLHVVEVLCKGNIDKNNSNVIVSDSRISVKRYEEETKSSDFNTILPLLFNFYHGIEVVLKGFTHFKSTTYPTHDIDKLVKDYAKIFKEDTLLDFFKKYTKLDEMPPLLRTFFEKTNKASASKFYTLFRYLENTNRIIVDAAGIMYQGNNSLQFFKDLHSDIRNAKKNIVTKGRQLSGGPA